MDEPRFDVPMPRFCGNEQNEELQTIFHSAKLFADYLHISMVKDICFVQLPRARRLRPRCILDSYTCKIRTTIVLIAFLAGRPANGGWRG